MTNSQCHAARHLLARGRRSMSLRITRILSFLFKLVSSTLKQRRAIRCKISSASWRGTGYENQQSILLDCCSESLQLLFNTVLPILFIAWPTSSSSCNSDLAHQLSSLWLDIAARASSQLMILNSFRATYCVPRLTSQTTSRVTVICDLISTICITTYDIAYYTILTYTDISLCLSLSL